ncbi:MAG: hypothetical protein A4E30_01024 [Methanomassiliicoccales archaeon PtaB.Bin215]|nr:MAG: hypothetical protein A4E30_01024 [Methanomassiliicoccales archaeon PtaB.Bin215]
MCRMSSMTRGCSPKTSPTFLICSTSASPEKFSQVMLGLSRRLMQSSRVIPFFSITSSSV